MWLILDLKDELLLGVYSSHKAADDTLKFLKKIDKKRVAERQIIVYYIDVAAFHEYVAPMFEEIKRLSHSPITEEIKSVMEDIDNA